MCAPLCNGREHQHCRAVGGGPRPPELPDANLVPAGSTWPLAHWELLIFQFSLIVTSSEKPSQLPMESTIPAPHAPSYLPSLLLVCLLPRFWHSLWFSCLFVVLFCLLNADCFSLPDWGHGGQGPDLYCFGAVRALISSCNQGKLLSLISSRLFHICESRSHFKG